MPKRTKNRYRKRDTKRKSKTNKNPRYGIGKHKLVYLEYRKGASQKFWQGELTRKKDTYFVTYGKIGTKGRSMYKNVGQYSPKRAQEIFQGIIESKIKKGYVLKNKVVY